MGYLYKLMLLNGPLSGREIQLREGVITFGLQDADVLLPLEGEHQELRLTVQDETILITPHTGAWIEESWVSSITELPIGKPVGILGVAMIVGRNEDDLSTFSDWKIPVASEQKIMWLSWPVRMLLGVLILSSVVAFGGGASLTGQGPEKKFNIQSWVAEYTRQHRSFSEVSFVWLSDGSLDMEGWCQREGEFKPLVAMLRRQQVAFHNNVICQDRLLSNVNYSLQLYGYERIQVEAGERHGEVVINGAIQDDSRWQQVERLLSTMPGLKNWKVLNQSDSEVAQLINQLRGTQLLGLLSIRRTNGRVVVSGKLNDKQAKRLSEALRGYMLKNPAAEAVTFQNIQAVGSDNGVLPAPIVSVGGNQQSPYLELSNGMRLQKGAELPSGYVVRNIDSENGVELSLHGQLVHIPLGF